MGGKTFILVDVIDFNTAPIVFLVSRWVFCWDEVDKKGKFSASRKINIDLICID